MERIVFEIILHGGNGKSSAMEAIQAAKLGDFKLAEEKLTEAKEALHQAHIIQTKLIQSQMNEDIKADVSLLMVHAQDHLMTAITVKDLATELVDVYQFLKKRREKANHDTTNC